ncbi:MAG: biotin-independent malonate decarboxylase subunit beta, partial [Lentisphaerae bacterium]|nr:biotin-independent malonate decarboxylase subunit beta [Lentisphaerota bacterium]
MKISATGWAKIQKKSFYRGSARERAQGLVDEGSFTEILGPNDKLTSPHLAPLGEVAQFDDGMVTGIGLLKERPVFI